jgi:CubicO group peptidase (beta-lactamase class C family)
VSDILAPATDHLLLHRVATGQVDGRAPSLIGAVARDGEVIWSGARGSIGESAPTVDTQYRIGSLTKTFTAVLVMRLRDEGLLTLEDPLRQHLPELALGDITVAQLLSHTGGLAGETPPPWWERVAGDVRPQLADVLGEGAISAPGRHFHYSNAGFAILGGLAAELRGRSWLELVREEILAPAGMSRTSAMPEAPHALGWAVHPWADVVLPEPTPDTGLMAPAGQLWSTLTDLARYSSVLLGDRPEILASGTAAQMRRPESPPTDRTWHEGQGLGLQLARVHGRKLFGHLGTMPGFTCACWINADERIAGIAFANATASPENISAVAADLIEMVATAHPRLPEQWTPLTDHDRALLDLAGVWYWGAAPAVLRLGAEHELTIGGFEPDATDTRFRARPDGTWVGLDGDYRNETLRIGRGADGEATHLDIGSFVFTRRPYDPATPIPGDVDPDGWR